MTKFNTGSLSLIFIKLTVRRLRPLVLGGSMAWKRVEYERKKD